VNAIALVSENPPILLFWLLHAPALILLPLISLLPQGVFEPLVQSLSPLGEGAAFQISVVVLVMAIIGWGLLIASGHYLWQRFLSNRMRRLTMRSSGP